MKRVFNHKKLVFCFLTIIFAISLLQICNFYPNTNFASTSDDCCYLKIKVTNFEQIPLQNAKVTIVENNQSYVTDKNGYTTLIKVPCSPPSVCNVIDGQFGFVNVVVSHEEYVDCILYNCVVYKNKTREGPVITMFSKSQTDAPYIAITEIPPDSWTTKFLTKIKTQ